MQTYILRRLLWAIPTLLLATSTVFIVMRIIPTDLAHTLLGDFATEENLQRLREQLGIDKPVWQQYFEWLGGLLTGDLGQSFTTGQPITKMLKDRLPVTIELTVLAVIIGSTLGITIGLIASIRPDSLLDYAARSFAITGIALPSFWVALLVLLIPTLYWEYFPPRFLYFWEDPLKNLQVMLPAAVVLAFNLSAVTMRMTRATVLEVLRQDYVRTAYSKGLQEKVVIWRHVLKNALLPVVTVIGLQMGFLLGGSIIVEQVFSLPGVGTMAFRGFGARDYMAVQGFVLFLAVVYIAINLSMDIMYGWLDPRIRFN